MPCRIVLDRVGWNHKQPTLIATDENVFSSERVKFLLFEFFSKLDFELGDFVLSDLKGEKFDFGLILVENILTLFGEKSKT